MELKDIITQGIIENLIFDNKTVDKINEAIQYAWNNWDADIVAPFYDGAKPELPTDEFIIDWVDNWDFEADGYDGEYLKEIFAP